jgi:subtilisin family serine protease
MNKFLSLKSFLLLLFALLIYSCGKNDFSPNTQDSISPRHYIVLLNEDIKDVGTLSSAGRESYVLDFLTSKRIDKHNITYIYSSVVLGFAAYLTEEQARNLSSDPKVSLVEIDKQFSVEPTETISVDKSDKPLANSQVVPWGISAVGGFIVTERSSRLGWIVDTGIDLYHPDLNVDVNLSRTFVRTGIDSTTPNDFHGHGTHVAGIIAAKNNDFGVVGVAAGNKVVAVKVLSSSGWGWDSDIIAGLDYISKRGKQGDVVNMSLGGDVSPAFDQAVVALGAKGFLVVLAAGNSRTNANTFSPARANGRNVITVSAHDINDNFASFSNYGNPPIDYCAPGVSIYSTYKNGSYATMSGTSMAAPHVAGILLANNKVVFTRGNVKSDPDYVPDRLASRLP